MSAMACATSDLISEFALVPETAAEAGLGNGALRPVHRDWVRLPDAGRVSGVFWGEGQPQLVLLHDAGESSRAWDAVALAAGCSLVAIDLPGHGRSDWLPDGRYEPRRIAPAVAEAIRSFAPRASLVAGVGLGALTAVTVGAQATEPSPRVALLNTLPGSALRHVRARAAAERFASRETALTVLAARRPELSKLRAHPGPGRGVDVAPPSGKSSGPAGNQVRRGRRDAVERTVSARRPHRLDTSRLGWPADGDRPGQAAAGRPGRRDDHHPRVRRGRRRYRAGRAGRGPERPAQSTGPRPRPAGHRGTPPARTA